MNHFARVFGHHEIDDWRDEHILMAAGQLNHVAGELISAAVSEIKSANPRRVPLWPMRFAPKRLAPKIRLSAEPVLESLAEQANRRLTQIVNRQGKEAEASAWPRPISLSAIRWPVIFSDRSFSVPVSLPKSPTRVIREIRSFVTACLLSGTAKSPSILAQVEQLFTDAAEQAKRRGC